MSELSKVNVVSVFEIGITGNVVFFVIFVNLRL